MEIVLDFCTGAQDQAEGLLACFQKALGHELPNQLVALQGLARVLESDLGERLDDEGRSLLRRLSDLTRRTDEQVRALAQLGRLHRDPGPTIPVLLPEAVNEAAAEVNLMFPGLAIEYDGKKEKAAVTVSRQALHHVLVQLLRNAARSACGGRLLRVVAGTRRTMRGTEVSIVDNGTGIAAARWETLFDAFAGDRAGGGMGLGLFSVRLLVAGWKGALTIRSEIGVGTAVTVLIPSL